MTYYYHCWFEECQYYGPNWKIENEEPLSVCPHCYTNNLQLITTPEEELPDGSRTAAGAAGGALLGWAVGGPPGALIGGIVGFLLGTSAEEEDRRKKVEEY